MQGHGVLLLEGVRGAGVVPAYRMHVTHNMMYTVFRMLCVGQQGSPGVCYQYYSACHKHHACGWPGVA